MYRNEKPACDLAALGLGSELEYTFRLNGFTRAVYSQETRVSRDRGKQQKTNRIVSHQNSTTVGGCRV